MINAVFRHYNPYTKPTHPAWGVVGFLVLGLVCGGWRLCVAIAAHIAFWSLVAYVLDRCWRNR